MRSDVARNGRAVLDARRRRAETLAAWERFVAGDDEHAEATLPLEILRSWRRCRDVHALDPTYPSVRPDRPRVPATPHYDGVYAQLGAVAATIVHDVGSCLATVADADGQIVASWHARGLGRHDTNGRFEPRVRWPESLAGTNGIGTALLLTRPIAVRGPEHWLRDMHDWTCVGLAVHDPVTARPVGGLAVAAHTEERVTSLAPRLAAELEPARRYLRDQALRDATAVAEHLRNSDDSGAVLTAMEHRQPPTAPERIAAVAGDSVLLLDPDEVRFAEAHRRIVWLTTDSGRFQAATKGMENLERELGRFGFIRVHRSFIVNPARVRGVVHKGSGLIALSTDLHRAECIPVSRRSTHEVRQLLGV
ncbi:MAG: LytTR family transcriptional regulator DNA-binding domain-containing protein [Pseudonocardia sp.]|nr:LytTR family transcriptional regulator DNA-binding domain-containing protein [Pseudonocardia sp.]